MSCVAGEEFGAVAGGGVGGEDGVGCGGMGGGEGGGCVMGGAEEEGVAC